MAETKVLSQPGDNVTGLATANISAGRFVVISANRTRANGENYKVAHAGAGVKPFGVSGHDIPSGSVGHILRGNPIVCIEASAAITAGAAVEVAANGMVKPLNTGIRVGVATEDGASGAFVAIALD